MTLPPANQVPSHIHALDETYGLLYFFEEQQKKKKVSFLSLAGLDIFYKIEQAINANNSTQVEQLIKILLLLGGLPRGSQGFAEVYLVAGWSYFRIGNLNEAVKLLREASSYYHSFDHQYMVSQWMLGQVLLERDGPGDVLEAVHVWQICVATIEKIVERHGMPKRMTRPYSLWKQTLLQQISRTV